MHHDLVYNYGMANKNQCSKCGCFISKKKQHSCQPAWNKGKKTGQIPRSSFKKGHIPWNKGRAWSNETKEKISKTHKIKGHAPPKRFWFTKGHKPHNADTKGIIKPNSGSFKLGHIPKHAGKTRPEISGEKHWNWQGGITPGLMEIRNSIEYKNWQKAIFERDDFTCQRCGKRGGEMHAHHIKSFAKFPKLRFHIPNGQTLCISCHYKIHSQEKLDGNCINRSLFGN